MTPEAVFYLLGFTFVTLYFLLVLNYYSLPRRARRRLIGLIALLAVAFLLTGFQLPFDT